MRRLGELLLERGAIEVSELYTALEACHRRGGRLGTQLLRFGFVEERDLLEALSEQLGVGFVPEELLLRASAACDTAMPVSTLERLQAVPFERMQRRLRVAMANPRDPAALEELATATGAEIEPYVASETAIVKALESKAKEDQVRQGRLDSIPSLMEAGGIAGGIAGGTAGGTADTASWERLWEPPRVEPEDLLYCRLTRPSAPPTTIVATFPDLTPVLDLNAGIDSTTLDDSTFLESLQTVGHRDEVAELLVRYAERYLGRVCLFALHRDRVVGWMGRGQSVVVEDVRSFSVPLHEITLFSRVLINSKPYLGPVPAGPGDRQLTRILGEPPAANLLVLPIGVKDRPVALLVGDNPGERSSGVPTQELAKAAQRAGMAFEILIMKAKLDS